MSTSCMAALARDIRKLERRIRAALEPDELLFLQAEVETKKQLLGNFRRGYLGNSTK